MAFVKLHSLLQTVLCLSWEEVCFLLGRIGAPLWPDKDATDINNTEHAEMFSQVVPVVRALLDQHADPVTVQQLLPSLPITNGSTTFAQDLKAYCHTLEWQSFYQQQVSSCYCVTRFNESCLLIIQINIFAKQGDQNFLNSHQCS